MGLQPTGSEIPRSLTDIGTTIDEALDSKADFIRITANPSTTTVASSYAISGSLSYDGAPITGPASLDFVSANLWSNSDGEISTLSVESGKWRLDYGDPLPQGSWLSVQTTATRPENCTWVPEADVSGTPIVAFTRATVATTGQFALVDDGVYDPVMWQNIGTDASPSWVVIVKAADLNEKANTSHTQALSTITQSGATSNQVPQWNGTAWVPATVSTDLSSLVTQLDFEQADGISPTAWGEVLGLESYAPLASPALTGNPTAPTQASGNNSTRIATTAFVAAGFVPRITSVDNRLTRFDGTTGAVQGSGITVDDSNNVSGVGNLTASGKITLQTTSSDSIAAIEFAGGNGWSTGSTIPGIVYSQGNVPRWGINYLSQMLVGGYGGLFFSGGGVSQATDVGIVRDSSGVLKLTTTAAGNVSHNALGSLALTNLTASGTLSVGGGTVVSNILSATATLDFPSISSNGTETLTITVTGAVAGDSVFLGCPAGLNAGLIFCASVTAANTVTVRMHNSSGGSVDPASGTFRATVIRF